MAKFVLMPEAKIWWYVRKERSMIMEFFKILEGKGT